MKDEFKENNHDNRTSLSKKLREEIVKEKFLVKQKILDLLENFYKNTGVSFDLNCRNQIVSETRYPIGYTTIAPNAPIEKEPHEFLENRYLTCGSSRCFPEKVRVHTITLDMKFLD